MNMVHEIVTGKRSVEDARETATQNTVAYNLGRAAPYAAPAVRGTAGWHGGPRPQHDQRGRPSAGGPGRSRTCSLAGTRKRRTAGGQIPGSAIVRTPRSSATAPADVPPMPAAMSDHMPTPPPARNRAVPSRRTTGRPPFDFLADLLLVGAVVPAAPIEAAFPHVPVLNLWGRALIVAWFSRIRESCYRDAAGSVRCTREDGVGSYAELTLLLVAATAASSGHASNVQRTERAASRAYYGMPKVLAPARFGERDGGIAAQVEQNTLVDAGLYGAATRADGNSAGNPDAVDLAGAVPERRQRTRAAPLGEARRVGLDPRSAPRRPVAVAA